jgi:hypothetical protein
MTQLPFSWPTASDIERRRVLAALRFCNSDENRAAKLLRVSFPWLQSKLVQFEREGFLVPKVRESEPAAILALASRNS